MPTMNSNFRSIFSKKNSKKQVTSIDDNDENGILDVVIIGAGWAGLGAARYLQDKNKTNFIILEGRDTIGGRCRPLTLDDGVSVAELGAQWIHGAHRSNPVYQAARSSGTSMTPSKYDSQSMYKEDDSGNVRQVPDKEIQSHMKKLMTKGFFPYQEKRQDDDPDVSLRQCAEDYLKKINATQEQRTWLNYILDAEISQEYGASLEDMSTHWWDSDEDIRGGDAHPAQDPQGGGYLGILNHYSKSVQDRVELNSKVTSIDWSQKHQVTVRYTQENQAKQLTAKHVLITVPLGVLKAKLIQFVPELPQQKQTVISRIGFGLYNKCIFLWKEEDAGKLPWPQDKEWVEKVVPPNETQGLWTEFFNSKPATGRPMLCAFTAGRIAEQVEAYSDAEIKSQALQSLRKIFAPRVIPDPLQVVVTKWGQDEFARGSYSFNALGSKHRDRKRLAAPVDQKLYFAGEACHSDYFGTTQGALLSGKHSAKQILRAPSLAALGHTPGKVAKTAAASVRVVQGQASPKVSSLVTTAVA